MPCILSVSFTSTAVFAVCVHIFSFQQIKSWFHVISLLRDSLCSKQDGLTQESQMGGNCNHTKLNWFDGAWQFEFTAFCALCFWETTYICARGIVLIPVTGFIWTTSYLCDVLDSTVSHIFAKQNIASCKQLWCFVMSYFCSPFLWWVQAKSIKMVQLNYKLRQFE